MSKETKVNNEKLLQWHPAFYAGLQIEFGEEAHKLIFEREHNLSTKPMQIDVVVIKKRTDEVIYKNIGRIFRKYNIIEYKSPTDYLSIDDFYKVYGYTCFYKSSSKHVDDIGVTELTITFVCKNYYIRKDIIPIQMIVTSELSEDVNLWLRNLTNDLASNKSIEKLASEYDKHDKDELYKSVMNIIIRANNEKFREAKDMCEALRELFADELEMSRNEGIREGRNEGRSEGIREGRREGIREVITNMLRKGMALNDICELAECSEEYVEEVRKTI